MSEEKKGEFTDLGLGDESEEEKEEELFELSPEITRKVVESVEATDLELGDDRQEEELQVLQPQPALQEELGNLPPEIAGSIASEFDSQEALEKALEQAGFGDLPVVLVDGKPRLVMPSPQHNKFTAQYAVGFGFGWAKDKWGYAAPTHKIHLQDGKGSREPDLSYWGFPRCVKDELGHMVAVDDSVPDVVIQFSWQNKETYETEAIDDMMNHALEEECGDLSATRPTLGYLIKVKFSKPRKLQNPIKGSATQDVIGLDIYRLPHGTTIEDARNGTKNASHHSYVPGGPEYLITITPGDLGISGFWAWWCGDYTISASLLYVQMRNFHEKRQRAGIAT
jgi:hypothetical protein